MPTFRRPAPGRLGRIVASALLAVLVVSVLAACSTENSRDGLHALLEKERLTEQTRLSLLLAVSAEKNAVLSASQADAASFVDQARQSMAAARENLDRLAELIDQGGEPKETAALAPVRADFAEIATVDATLVHLVGRNTNLRAALASRTEAAQALARFRQALAPIEDGQDCPAARDALRAEAAAAAILTLHAPHIEETTDAGMDVLEARIAAQNDRVAASLVNLAAMLQPEDQASLDAAKGAYADFWKITQEILRLSRENTNIHTLALVLGKKRLVTAKAVDDLTALAAVVQSKEFKATR